MTVLIFFGAIGSHVSRSGFEETLHQCWMCQPGVMSSVLSGKYDIICWT